MDIIQRVVCAVWRGQQFLLRLNILLQTLVGGILVSEAHKRLLVRNCFTMKHNPMVEEEKDRMRLAKFGNISLDLLGSKVSAIGGIQQGGAGGSQDTTPQL